MNQAIKFFEKQFSDDNSKQAYLKACKWAATNIVNKVEIGETFWKVVKVEKASSPTFKLELYCMQNDEDFQKSFCQRCKELHKSFFINEEYNCNRCNMLAYSKDIKSKLEIKKAYRKSLINREIKD